jgi:hypothetical protein
VRATPREKQILSDLILGLMLEIVELKERVAELEAEREEES